MHPNVNELNSLPMALCRVSSNATVVLSLLVTAERPNRCPTIALTLVATVAMVAECLNCHSTHRLYMAQFTLYGDGCGCIEEDEDMGHWGRDQCSPWGRVEEIRPWPTVVYGQTDQEG